MARIGRPGPLRVSIRWWSLHASVGWPISWRAEQIPSSLSLTRSKTVSVSVAPIMHQIWTALPDGSSHGGCWPLPVPCTCLCTTLFGLTGRGGY